MAKYSIKDQQAMMKQEKRICNSEYKFLYYSEMCNSVKNGRKIWLDNSENKFKWLTNVKRQTNLKK